MADEFGIERRVENFDDLLAMDDLDIIDVCTPPMVHYPMVMAALKAGKHVICEKPLVGSLAQVDEVIAQEKLSKGRLMPVFQYRFGNGIQQAKAIIDAGLAGKPYVGTVETLWRREAKYYEVPWRGKWKTELGGVLMGHAIHPHDIFCYLMGSPKKPVRAGGDAGEPDRGGRLRVGLAGNGKRGAGELYRFARLGRRDHPHPARLRECDHRKRPRRPIIRARRCGRSCRAMTRPRRRSMRCWPTGRTCHRGSPRRCAASGMRSRPADRCR